MWTQLMLRILLRHHFENGIRRSRCRLCLDSRRASATACPSSFSRRELQGKDPFLSFTDTHGCFSMKHKAGPGYT